MALERAKKAMLTQAEREANLAKMLDESAIKERMYHGTPNDFERFGDSPTFLSPDPDFAASYGAGKADMVEYYPTDTAQGVSVMPLHVKVDHPFDYENKDHVSYLTDHLRKQGYDYDAKDIASGSFEILEDPAVYQAMKDLGYDAFHVNEGYGDTRKNLGVFDPKRIKSAIGNQGTYDTTNPDITKAHGGIVHMADGGSFNPQSSDYDYQTARAHGMGQGDNGHWGSVAPASESERKLHGLPEDSYLMLKGAEHPTWGKAVEAEEARGSKIVKHGDRYYSVPRFDEGGDVSAEREQAELDRMRLELSNSPVIEATPQSTTQKLLGTVGGYMDRAGKFINKSLEPIAESNPVKTFLADMLLASPLKGAGTALQDYTKTSRDITEEQPYTRSPLTGSGETLRLDPRVLDIAQFASPVVRGATKLAGAGAKALTPFAKSTAEMAADLYSSGKMPFTVAPNAYMAEPTAPKPSRVLAPANEQGFYSPTEAAALNLPRKSGSGQAFLNDIMKGENVRSEEISTMGLDTFLKDKKNVTAAEVQDYIAQNKLGLGETLYGAVKEDPVGMANRKEIFDFYQPEIDRLYKKHDAYFDAGDNASRRKVEDQIINVQLKRNAEANSAYEIPNSKPTKFEEHALPGGENYREVVLTLPSNRPSLKNMSRSEYNAAVDAADKAGVSDYKSTHWDEPNPLAHLRMSDRVTDGKKTLLVDEVQSDWHQAARDARTAEVKRLIDEGMPKEEAQKAVPKNFGYRAESNTAETAFRDYQTDVKNRFENLMRNEFSNAYSDPEKIESLVQRAMQDNSVRKMSDHFGEVDKWEGLYRDTNLEDGRNRFGVPDAPFKDDWYQLALKRAVKEAIDGGYDRVALPTGKRVADRFDLTAYIDRIDYNKNPDGTYRMSAIKDGQEVFTKTRANEKELPDIVGKEVAEKIRKNEGKTNNLPVDEFDADDVASQTYQTLSGLDLAVGGEGMKKYYDEIYPAYLKKFGKKYGANVGSTRVEIPPKSSGEVLNYDGGQAYANGQITWSEFLQRSPEAAKEFTEPLHYMDITPAMRKEFSTGIHMKDGGSVNLAEGGIVAGAHGLEYTDDGKVSMEDGGYVPMRHGGKVELTNDLAKMRNELQMKKGRK
jgi:hypothetical protein